jgi:hypothetical protein
MAKDPTDRPRDSTLFCEDDTMTVEEYNSRARTRLGSEPIRALFMSACPPNPAWSSPLFVGGTAQPPPAHYIIDALSVTWSDMLHVLRSTSCEETDYEINRQSE